MTTNVTPARPLIGQVFDTRDSRDRSQVLGLKKAYGLHCYGFLDVREGDLEESTDCDGFSLAIYAGKPHLVTVERPGRGAAVV